MDPLAMSSETDIAESIRYAGLGADDATRLVAIAPHLRASFEHVADAFYSTILRHDEARAVLRHDGRIAGLRVSLVRWLETLVSGRYDDAHFAYAARIGEIHVAIGLPQRYMPLAMGVLRRELSAAIAVEGGSRDTALALDRLLDVELTVMMEGYRRCADARVRAVRGAQRTERLAALGLLAAGLAHEIRNPLNGAHLHVTFLERELERSGARSDLRDAVHVVDGELERLSALVTEFLQFARPQPLSKKPTSLAAVVRRAEAVLGPDARAAGVLLDVDVPPAPIEVLADEDKLEQAVLNLGKNAVEAFAGKSPGHVWLRVRGIGDDGVIEVEDDGPGIAAPDAPIFDVFFSTKPGGTGLGLPIAHRIVTDHDGTLSVDSRPGRTVFSVALPTEPAAHLETR